MALREEEIGQTLPVLRAAFLKATEPVQLPALSHWNPLGARGVRRGLFPSFSGLSQSAAQYPTGTCTLQVEVDDLIKWVSSITLLTMWLKYGTNLLASQELFSNIWKNFTSP
jgi:hypothetical protein